MNQHKIGMFMKSLRKEKGLTQEQLAEVFNVSNRTVSRWENGNNMPDLDLLIEISDFYEVDLREILDGERRNEEMDNDMKETVLKAAEYATEDWALYYKRMKRMMMIGVIGFVVSGVISRTPVVENQIAGNISDFILGMSCSFMVFGIIITSVIERKSCAFKKRMFCKFKKNITEENANCQKMNGRDE